VRPVAEQHSAVRYPLDYILGSEANVRLLRVLMREVNASGSVPDVARLAGLTPAGARRALDRLLESGVVECIGSGRTVQFKVRDQEPLIQTLALLFEKEGERYDVLLSSLRNALSGLPEIRAAWLHREPTGSGAPMEMSVVADVKAIDWIGEELRARLKKIEKDYDQIIEVNVFTRADSPVPSDNAEFIIAMEPDMGMGGGAPQSHVVKDQRSLLMAQEIVRMMRSDPSLIMRAKRHLDRLLHDQQGAAAQALAEWRQLLDTYSSRQIMQFLVSTSSRANRLRQSSPFFAVLTAEERDKVLSALEETK